MLCTQYQLTITWGIVRIITHFSKAAKTRGKTTVDILKEENKRLVHGFRNVSASSDLEVSLIITNLYTGLDLHYDQSLNHKAYSSYTLQYRGHVAPFCSND